MESQRGRLANAPLPRARPPRVARAAAVVRAKCCSSGRGGADGRRRSRPADSPSLCCRVRCGLAPAPATGPAVRSIVYIVDDRGEVLGGVCAGRGAPLCAFLIRPSTVLHRLPPCPHTAELPLGCQHPRDNAGARGVPVLPSQRTCSEHQRAFAPCVGQCYYASVRVPHSDCGVVC